MPATGLFFVALVLVSMAEAQTYRYWIEPCEAAETTCLPGDVELAEWALAAWRSAADGRLVLERTDRRGNAHIRVIWAGAAHGLYGEARPIVVDGKRHGAEVYVRPDLRALGPAINAAGSRDPLFRETVVYLTCLHEIGHALGLRHTCEYDDIMYSFGCGGDVLEYFQRYRSKLRNRSDIAARSGLSPHDRELLRRLLTR